jgi:hypothetical protein
MAKGYSYIMTNPCLKDMVKIGYATDAEARRKQLNTTMRLPRLLRWLGNLRNIRMFQVHRSLHTMEN